jgi:hypothetical protein
MNRDILKFIGGILFLIVLLSCALSYLYWFFPAVSTRDYEWGKLICVEIKQPNNWVSTIKCFKQ